jgi:GMP synthase (glutamine-hydrolysing)
LFDIAKAKKDWKVSVLKDSIVQEIKDTIGPKAHVLVAVSGGVDSLVVATLVAQALGPKRTHAVLIDTGLLRKNEAQEVLKGLKANKMTWLKVEDASRLFLSRLEGISEPEHKRKVIGHTFIEVFESYIAKNLKKYPITHLAQGTIYPDRIESAQPNKQASKIKSHHNLTLPEKMKLGVLEPIRELYKDEVRELGLALGLPRHLLFRHPFPGPGLAIRVLGEVTKERIDILQNVDAVYMEELKRTGEYEKIWQAFAALLPVKSVGVMGDARTYEYITSLRAVDSIDGMTAEWHRIPESVLAKISNRIVNEVRGVNRVLFDITQKPPGTIEYE